MGKGYIGNKIPNCMIDILLGEVSIDDIDTIYSESSYTIDSIPLMLESYNSYWKIVAKQMAEREIAKSNGFDDEYALYAFWEREDDEDNEYIEEHTEEYKRLHEEVKEKEKELLSKVIDDAKNVLYQLYKNGKIVSIKYRIPKGKTLKVKTFPGYGFDEDGQIINEEDDEVEVEGELEHEIEVTGGEGIINEEVLYLDGEYYTYGYNNEISKLNYLNNYISSGPLSNNNWFFNKLDLIALQLYCGYRDYNSQYNRDRTFALEKIFPEYKNAIEYATKEINKYTGQKRLLEMLQEGLKENKEHIPEEIPEAVEDLSQGEITETLNAITNLGERTSYEQEKEK